MSNFTSPPPISADAKPLSLSFPEGYDSRVAVLTLDDVATLNALQYTTTLSLIACLEWIAKQPHLTITILTGRGRFFSAGANLKDPSRKPTINDPIERGRYYASRINAGNGALARALSTHPKVLIGAMNGPAVGISAAILGHCDLLYTSNDFYLFTPFTSIGLVAEGGTSLTFVRKMGIARAQEALLEGRRLTAAELDQCGFITRILDVAPRPANADKSYTLPVLEKVLEHVREKLMPPTVNPFALLYTKRLIQEAAYPHGTAELANQAELRGAEIVFASGEPDKQFSRLAAGGRHKL